MNASFRRLHGKLGAVALIALAAGCARERRPAAPVGRTPMFESQMPEEPGTQGTQGAPGTQHDRGEGAPGHEGALRHGEEGLRTPREGAGGLGTEGRQQGAEGRQQGAEERRPGAPSAPMNEGVLCQALTQNADLRAENIPGGVQIVVTATSDANAAALRQVGNYLQNHLDALGQGQQPQGEAGARCELFEPVRMGARGRVMESANGLRIVFTGQDAADVASLRQHAQAFVQSANEMKSR